MSFGFGFALPAYPLRGGGGNNPFNQDGPTLDMSFVDGATNVGDQLGADTYTLNTDFITPEYQVAAQYAVWVDGSGLTQRNFADIVTFSRGSNATQFDSTGSLVFAPNNAIRNNTMQGTVAPFTFPTNWQTVPVPGITATIVGTGTQNGIAYLDVRVSGTPTVSSYYNLVPDILVAGATGQTWTGSFWASFVAGSLTNTNANLEIRESDAAQGFLANTLTTLPITSTLTRYSQARTLTNASTAFVSVRFVWQVTSGLPVDFTLRIGLPQLERGPVATAVNATVGTAYYGPRFDYDPATLLARGLLIEEQRTNSIRNNTMQGAVAGTPGTLPQVSGSPIWSAQAVGGVALTEVVGTGTENGITYIDLRYTGTTSSTTAGGILTESPTQITAASGQTWASSFYVRLVGGSTSGITDIFNAIQERDAAGALLASTNTTISPTGAALNTQRVATTRTLNNVSTARITQQIRLVPASGVAIDITLRIGLPQLELGAFATSVIPTTTTALTRSTDVASVNTLSPWYNASAGTLFAEAVTFDSLSGAFPASGTFSDGTVNNRNAIVRNNGSGNARMSIVSGGAVQAAADATAWTLNATTKMALAFATNDFAIVANGGAAATDTSGSVPTATQFRLGSDWGGLGQFLNGWLRRVTYYPRRLSNVDLQTITI